MKLKATRIGLVETGLGSKYGFIGSNLIVTIVHKKKYMKLNKIP